MAAKRLYHKLCGRLLKVQASTWLRPVQQVYYCTKCKLEIYPGEEKRFGTDKSAQSGPTLFGG